MPDATTATPPDVDRTVTVTEPLPDPQERRGVLGEARVIFPGHTTTVEDEVLHLLRGATLPATCGR